MFTEKFKQSIKNKADFILKYWALIGIIVAIIGFGYKYTFGTYNKIESQLENIRIIATNNQQMTLKNAIWNEDIPIEDRTSACDIYLSAGYNSLTKKKCESIIEKGANEGIFSYTIKEREVIENE